MWYDLNEDISETANRASERLDLVKKLDQVFSKKQEEVLNSTEHYPDRINSAVYITSDEILHRYFQQDPIHCKLKDQFLNIGIL